MKRLLLSAALVLSASAADAATLTLPSFTIVNPPPPSTSITCTQVAPFPFAPVAVGTILWNCSVAPANWVGTVSLSGSNSVTLSGTNGNAFSVQVGPTALVAGTYVPGNITSTP
jgi:hypothetical protein